MASYPDCSRRANCLLRAVNHTAFSLQTVSVLLDEGKVFQDPAGGTSFDGPEGALDVLASLGRAVAIGFEAGEEVDEVSSSTVNLRVR